MVDSIASNANESNRDLGEILHYLLAWGDQDSRMLKTLST